MSHPSTFLTAEWRTLLMFNYAVDPAVIQCYVPRGTSLDTYDGKTYVSVVGFMFVNARLGGIPIPFHRHFEEVNLRFYVKRDIDGTTRHSVVFIKQIVPRWAVAAVAKHIYNENFHSLPMDHSEPEIITDGSEIVYRWKLANRWNTLSARVSGNAHTPEPDSLEHFISEHYLAHSIQKDGGTLEYRVYHPMWNIWDVRDPVLDADIAALYGPTFTPVLSKPPDSAFLADGSRVTVFRGVRLNLK